MNVEAREACNAKVKYAETEPNGAIELNDCAMTRYLGKVFSLGSNLLDMREWIANPDLSFSLEVKK
jgi:hypothetical protein